MLSMCSPAALAVVICRPTSTLQRDSGDFLQIAVFTPDMRRTYATVAGNTEIAPFALKALLNHSVGSDVTAGYIVSMPTLKEAGQKSLRPNENVVQRECGQRRRQQNVLGERK